MYKLINNNLGQLEAVNLSNIDGSVTSIPINDTNTDYQAYLLWLSEGNTPIPADKVV